MIQTISLKKFLIFTFFIFLFLLSVTYLVACDTKQENDGIAQKNNFELDTNRLGYLHDLIWTMIDLSDETSQDLSKLVSKFNPILQKNKLHSPNFINQLDEDKPKDKLEKEELFEIHKKAFQEYELSTDSQEELMDSLSLAWRALNDPNAYLDPTYDVELGKRFTMLFSSGAPPCCNIHFKKKSSEPEK